jgi:hypothetical protein
MAMNNRIKKPALMIGTVLLAASIIFLSLNTTGCRDPITVPPIRYVIFVDTTASITEKQSAHWVGIADKAIAKLRSGDALAIYEITDRTLESRELFEAEPPVCPKDAGQQNLTECKSRLSAARKGAREALQKALASKSHARSTDIFSAMDRVKPDPGGRRTVLLFLSDMLHSLVERGDPNLEKSVITPDHMGRLIEGIAQHHGWQPGTLTQAEIHVILPSASSGDAKPLNDRRALKQFYQLLFSALGARLLTFDTSLTQSLS